MILPGGADIATAAGDSAEFISLGSGNWMCLSYTRANGAPLSLAGFNLVRPRLHVRDEKASGTNGGTFTSGAWRTRDLTVERTNTISGASLASNQITLPAGTYDVRAWANAESVSFHKAALFTVDGTLIREGGNAKAVTSSSSLSVIEDRFTLAATTVLELRHRSNVTQATNGFGAASSFGIPEVYSEVVIERVS
jgi:hypothetical protein